MSTYLIGICPQLREEGHSRSYKGGLFPFHVNLDVPICSLYVSRTDDIKVENRRQTRTNLSTFSSPSVSITEENNLVPSLGRGRRQSKTFVSDEYLIMDVRCHDELISSNYKVYNT